MASRITFNSKNVDFPSTLYRIQVDPIHGMLRNKSASGIVETLNVNIDEIISVGWRNFANANATDATLKRNLRQWFQWAQEGNSWTLALDSAEAVLTTLSSSAAVGATSITLTSGAGVTADKQYILRNATSLQLVKILSVAGSPTFTLYESLDFAFAAGARFRSEQYWPGRLAGNKNPVIEMPPLHYDFSLEFMEDVNSL